MTPMFAVSPLSPERARHKRMSGTRIMRSDVNVVIPDDHALLYRVARHERGPEGHHFRGFRPPLVCNVGDAGHSAEHPRHELRREARIDLALVLIAHSKLHEHLAGLAVCERRVTRVPPDELMQRLLVRALSPGGVPECL